MQSVSNKPKRSLLKRRSLQIAIVVLIILSGYLVSTELLKNQEFKAQKDTLDKVSLLSDQPRIKQVCTDISGGNENHWNAATYAAWYEKVHDSDDTIKQLIDRAKAVGYNLKYEENSSPYMPQDFTIKKDVNITAIPAREPNFTLIGKKSIDKDNQLFSIEGYRGTVNIQCNTREGLDPTLTTRTITAPSGEILLRSMLSRE